MQDNNIQIQLQPQASSASVITSKFLFADPAAMAAGGANDTSQLQPLAEDAPLEIASNINLDLQHQ